MQGASRKEEGRCTIKGRTENRGFLSRREGNRSERFRVCSEVHGARVESREPTAKRKATQITGGNQREYHRHKAVACGQGLWGHRYLYGGMSRDLYVLRPQCMVNKLDYRCLWQFASSQVERHRSSTGVKSMILLALRWQSRVRLLESGKD